MGQTVTLTASDDFKLGGYRADPASAPKGAIVVIQEIFGVNSHIRNICDRFAKEGYVALAPAIFDAVYGRSAVPDDQQPTRFGP